MLVVEAELEDPVLVDDSRLVVAELLDDVDDVELGVVIVPAEVSELEE